MPPPKPPHLALRTPTARPTRTPISRRPSPSSTTNRAFSTSKPQHATLIPRPFRVYQFTQLVTLSDGSTFTHRTTSPAPVYRSSKDARNTPMWNPSNARMANVEEDRTGRLRAFRSRFGRGWDAESAAVEESEAVAAAEAEAAAAEAEAGLDDTVDDGALDGEGKVTVLDGVGARVEGRVGKGGKGVARPVAAGKGGTKKQQQEQSEWGGEEGEGAGSLMDLIGSFGLNEGAGGAKSGSHLGGSVSKGGKVVKPGGKK